MRIAALQMSAAAGDPAANLARIDRSAQNAPALMAPSCWSRPNWRCPAMAPGRRSRPSPKPPMDRPRSAWPALAEATGIAIIAGFAERDGDAVFNSALFVAPGGARHVYRKSHLYGDYERAAVRRRAAGGRDARFPRRSSSAC